MTVYFWDTFTFVKGYKSDLYFMIGCKDMSYAVHVVLISSTNVFILFTATWVKALLGVVGAGKSQSA